MKRTWLGVLFCGCAVVAASCDSPVNDGGAGTAGSGGGHPAFAGSGGTASGASGHASGGAAVSLSAAGNSGVAGEVGGPSCSSLSLTSCAHASGCRVLSALPLQPGPPECRGAAERAVGCTDADMGCNGTETIARDPQGNDWGFFDSCLPAGWEERTGGFSSTPICAGGSGDEGGAGGLGGADP